MNANKLYVHTDKRCILSFLLTNMQWHNWTPLSQQDTIWASCTILLIEYIRLFYQSIFNFIGNQVQGMHPQCYTTTNGDAQCNINIILSSYYTQVVPHLRNGLFSRPSEKMKALSSDCNLLFRILRSSPLHATPSQLDQQNTFQLTT